MAPIHATRYAGGGTTVSAPGPHQNAQAATPSSIYVNGFGAHKVAELVQHRVSGYVAD